MDIQLLSNFLVVAREGNITKAAKLVHLTQSTLSRQMIGLEKELGVQLLERQKYSVTLTEEGMLFRRRVQEIVSLSEMAMEELARASEELQGEVAVGCNAYYREYVNKLGTEYFDRSTFVAAQFEFQDQ